MPTFDFGQTFDEAMMAPIMAEVRDKLVDVMIRKCPVDTGATLRGENGTVDRRETLTPLAEGPGGVDEAIGGQLLGYSIVVGAGPPGNPSEKYVLYLQLGTSKMAPRPLLPTEDEVLAVLQEVFGERNG